MQDQLISFQTAKLAKQKGFNLLVLKYYDGSYMIATQAKTPFDIKNYNLHKGSTFYSAPTQSLLQCWVREIYKCHILIYTNYENEEVKWQFTFIAKYDNPLHEDCFNYVCDSLFNSYESALEQALFDFLTTL